VEIGFRTDGKDGLGRVQLLLMPHGPKVRLISGATDAIRIRWFAVAIRWICLFCGWGLEKGIFNELQWDISLHTRMVWRMVQSHE